MRMSYHKKGKEEKNVRSVHCEKIYASSPKMAVTTLCHFAFRIPVQICLPAETGYYHMSLRNAMLL